MTTIADLLSAATAVRPDSIALVCGDRRLTYAEWLASSLRIAEALRERGVREGTHVAVQLPRSVGYLVAYFGAAMCSATIVPLSPDLPASEAAAELVYCDVGLLITSAPLLARMRDELAGLVPVDATLLLDPGSGQPVSPATGSCVPRDTAGAPPGLALLLHTSGTTTAPRRVMLTHRNVLANAAAHVASLGLTSDDVVLIALPPYFGYCNTAQILAHTMLGGTLVMMPGGFTPAQFSRVVEQERVSTVTAVPTMLLYLLEHEAWRTRDLSSLRYVCFGGSPMPQERLMALSRALPDVGFVQTYGLTEAGPRVTTMRPEDAARKGGSVGRAIPGVEIAVTSESGTRCLPGAVGEVTVRSEGVMAGYYKRPEATAAVLRGGWLLTGDLGYLDDEGFLFLSGRKKNVIIRGGINVYPERVEEHLLAHTAVAEAVVVGVYHDLQGEIPVAQVVARPGVPVSDGDVMAFCRRRLAPHEVPARVEFVAVIEKTYNQKVRRYR